MSRSASANEEFEKLLASYRSNYMQYIVTGQPAYQTAYENIYKQIDQMIEARQQQVQNEKTAATQFLSGFKQDHQDVQGMRDKVKTMVDEIQDTKNQYQAAKSRYENTDVASSISPKNEVGLGIVLRLGILLLLIPVFFLVGYFYPRESAAAAAQAQQDIQSIGQQVAALGSGGT